MMLAVTRNLHTYIRNQMASRWEPVGGEAYRSDFVSGPASPARWTAHRNLGDLTLGIVGLGQIGTEIAALRGGV